MQPATAEAMALALLLALAAIRFGSALLFPAPLGDELAYDRGFALAAAGASPYGEPGFLYPPVFARLGAGLRAWGAMTPLYLLRALNLAAAVWLAWRCAAWLPWSRRGRWLAGAAVLLLSPALAQGIVLGNVSFLVAAIVVGALLAWPRWPVGAGALLALSLAVKPLAPAAIIALAAHRPAAASGNRHRRAAAAAIVLGALALLAVPGIGEFLSRGNATSVLESTVSPYRLVVLVGSGPSPLWWTLGLLALLGWAIRRSPLARDALLAAALVGSLAVTPMVWNHTLLLTLPLQAMAVDCLLTRRRVVDGRRPAGVVEILLVGLAVIALHTAEGATGITDRSAMLQALASLPAILAPGLLLAYVLRAPAQVR